MMRACVCVMAVAVLASCWEGHDSCGIAPPMGGTDEAPQTPRSPPPWTPARIEDALRIDPLPLMKTLARDRALIVADADAGSHTSVCDTAALAALSEFADELGPRNEPPGCVELGANHEGQMLVCIRPHDGRSFVALAFFRRGERWDLTALVKGTARAATVDAQLLDALPAPVCP